MAENIDADRAADLAAFAKWKGYELPPFNSDGHFDKDWLHREWVAFCAGRRTPSASIGEDGLPELPNRIYHWNGMELVEVADARQFARDAIAADRRARVTPEMWASLNAAQDQAQAAAQSRIDRRARLLGKTSPQAAQGVEVGAVVGMSGSGGGFTMCAFNASDVPIGTKLYAAPPLSSEQQAEKGAD